ncbi:hypothetical protein BAXH7_02307 [Bacillus amyloliquefaciens XH7]|nr:hypothetical protein BAXH7_02307 [Bacillus amyloliquefaciens XH7]
MTIDYETAGALGKITAFVLYLAVMFILLKGIFMMWRESRYERK